MKNQEYEDLLKSIVRDSEARYIWYKQQLELVFKDKVSFPPGDELTEWYKEHLRESKNRTEGWLKENVEELTYYRQCLNPPFLYKYKKKSS